MQHNLPPLPVRIAVAVVVLGVIAYFGYTSLTDSSNGQITASGSIEATIVNVSPEIAGRVKEVLAEEGQSVQQNETLLHLDPILLQQQRNVAAASLDLAKASSVTASNALEIAKAQYQVALQAALTQDKKARLGDWYAPDQEQFDQPNWYFTRSEQAQAAQLQVDEALIGLDAAKAKLVEIANGLDSAKFLATEQRLLNARLAYQIAKDVYTRAHNSTSANSPLSFYNLKNCAKDKGYVNVSIDVMIRVCKNDQNLVASSEALYNAAKTELEGAQKEYNDLLTTDAANDVLRARAEVSVMQEKYYAALDRLRALQTGDQSQGVTAAQGVVDQAQAAYNQTLEAVKQAQANVELLDAQMAKLDIVAPMNGVILTRNVEPGEFVQPGAVALTLADLSSITITVYVPEDLYGNVSIGQPAEVRVDSFPDITFNASVMQIANQAEFTPRNVQTVEGRSSTFFAIKLKVEDPEGKLKIGMPADVVFK